MAFILHRKLCIYLFIFVFVLRYNCVCCLFVCCHCVIGSIIDCIFVMIVIITIMNVIIVKTVALLVFVINVILLSLFCCCILHVCCSGKCYYRKGFKGYFFSNSSSRYTFSWYVPPYAHWA